MGEALGIPAALAGASVVVTGEGRFDAQSAAGKVPSYLAALASDAALLDEAEQGALSALVQQVRDAIARSSDESIAIGARQDGLHNAVQTLAHGTEEFAARRMDKSVRSALAGKKLSEV